MKRIPYKQWVETGRRLYGDDPRRWRFKCPVCGHVQSVASVQQRRPEIAESGGAQERSIMHWIHYSCEGRLDENPRSAFEDAPDPDAGCDYTLGGLFNFAPITVVHGEGESHSFAFADEVIDDA